MPLPTVRGIILIALLTPTVTARAQSVQPPSALEAERAVVEFYSWYVRMSKNDPGPDMHAVRERRAQFDATLVRALRADSVATAQGGEEISGLDADPFLNAQDPCERYSAVGTRRLGNDYLIEMRGEGGCQDHKTPDVTVQVTWRDRHPVFVNFLYSRKRGDDLLSLLKSYAAQRRRDAHLIQ